VTALVFSYTFSFIFPHPSPPRKRSPQVPPSFCLRSLFPHYSVVFPPCFLFSLPFTFIPSVSDPEIQFTFGSMVFPPFSRIFFPRSPRPHPPPVPSQPMYCPPWEKHSFPREHPLLHPKYKYLPFLFIQYLTLASCLTLALFTSDVDPQSCFPPFSPPIGVPSSPPLSPSAKGCAGSTDHPLL